MIRSIVFACGLAGVLAMVPAACTGTTADRTTDAVATTTEAARATTTGPVQTSRTPATSAPATATHRLRADVWADNWFALSVNGVEVGTDREPLTQERSFNSETFTFTATFPLVVALVAKDYIASDSGLEYLGTDRQQIGDGGVIAQIVDLDTGRTVVATDATWRAFVTHHAPVDPACAGSSAPDRDCRAVLIPEPDGWRRAGFDDSRWAAAAEYSAEQVGVKGGYASIGWQPPARLVWSGDLRLDNTVLLRRVVEAWS